MSEITGVLAAAMEVELFCRQQGWRFCFIGGLAVQRWGMPRFTQDVDLTLMALLGEEAPVVDAFLGRFAGRIREARQFALDHRVVLSRTAAGVDVDVALGALAFEEATIERATIWSIRQELALTTCSAEDLVLHKVFAGRDRDWSDVESVLSRQHGRLDMAQIRRELPPLLEMKEEPASLDRFEQVVRTVDERMN